MFEHRHDRLQQILLEEINTLIVSRKIKDPRLSSHVSVVQTVLSSDLSFCTVYVSGFLEPEKIEANVKILNRAKGFIQQSIGQRHRWKHTPKLQFKVSNSLLEGDRILEKIKRLSQEDS